MMWLPLYCDECNRRVGEWNTKPPSGRMTRAQCYECWDKNKDAADVSNVK